MAAVARIVLEMDDKGVVTALQRTEQGFKKVGQQGNVVMTGLAQQQRQASQAAQLFSQVLGVQIPSALEKALAKSKIAGPALAGMFNASLWAAAGVAVISVITDVVKMIDEYRHAAERARAEIQKGINAAGLQSGEALTGQLSGLRARRNRALRDGLSDFVKVERELKDELLQTQLDMAEAERKYGDWVIPFYDEKLKLLKEVARAETDALNRKREQARVEAELKQFDERFAEFDKRRAEIAAVTRKTQDENIALVLESMEGEQRVNAQLEVKLALLRDLKRQYKDNTDFVEAATGQEVLIQQRAASGIAQIRREANERMMREWEAAVSQMAGDLRSFMQSPLQFLKRQWEDFLLRIAASWLVNLKGMQRPGASPGGGIFGGIGSILFGGGGLGGFGTATTPPFNPGASFAGGGLLGIPLSGGGGWQGLGSTLPTGGVGGSPNVLQHVFNSPWAGGTTFGPLFGLAGVGLGIGGFMRGSPVMGAAGGALAGFAVGGPIGAIIGGIIGLIGGLFGRSRKKKKRDAVEREAFRAIDVVKNAYNVHQMDYNSAIAQLEQIRVQVSDAMRAVGYPSRMDQHIDAAIRYINQKEDSRFRNAQTHAGLPRPEFDSGGWVFGGGAVPVLAHGGEAILTPQQQAIVGTQRIDHAFNVTRARHGGGRSSSSAPSFASGGMVSSSGYTLHVEMNFPNVYDARGFEQTLKTHSAALVSVIRRAARDQGLSAPV